MGKIGRNDKCICGSGLKYKKCCGVVLTSNLLELKVKDILTDVHSDEISIIIVELYNIIQNLNWGGACHSISSILYILLTELGLDATLCIGEVKSKIGCFDHSWVELDNRVYDIAICKGLNGVVVSNPIVNSYDIITKQNSTLLYGGERIYPMDRDALAIMYIPFTEYMDSFPINNIMSDSELKRMSTMYDYAISDLWSFVIGVGSKVGLELDRNTLRSKYENTIRQSK